MHAIELKNVTKIYRKGLRGTRVPAVTNLSFTVKADHVTGFAGPNGAGKTTTIKMITGLVHPTSGTVYLNDQPARHPAARRGVAFLSEQPYFYAHLTVREMLGFTARLAGITAGSPAAEIDRVLAVVELTNNGGSKVRELSKGMQQRLNMAQALLGNPHTLVLDEPMSGMDPPGRRLFRELLTRLRDENKTIFFSTHILDDIESTCDDVVVLHQGKLTYNGPVTTLLDEGCTGTEITTGSLTDNTITTLTKAGCAVSYPDRSVCQIAVDREDDPSVILQILAGQAVYPLQVIRKTMRLEDLLYRKQSGGTL